MESKDIKKNIIKEVIKIGRDKQQQLIQRRDQRKRNIRIEDLYTKVHNYKHVTLPYPNAYAFDILNRFFDGLENMDVENFQHIGVCIHVLENCKDVSLRDMDRKQLLKLADKRLLDIPAGDEWEYVVCIDDIFSVIKKKVFNQTQTMLADLQKCLDGAISASDSPKSLDSQ